MRMDGYTRRSAAALLAAGLVLVTSGCVMRPRDATGPAADAIEAALAIDFDKERLPLLRRIAARPDLTPPTQLYLVDAICHGGFGGAQADALIALIENSDCTPAARKRIAGKLRSVRFSTDRRRVVEALIEQPPDTQPAS